MIVAKTNGSEQDAAAHVQFLAVRENLHLLEGKPTGSREPKGQGQPVRHIHQVLVYYYVPGDFGLEPVIPTGKVCPWIMNSIGYGFRSSSSGGKVTVPQGTEGLAQVLFLRIVPFIN
jgi:hypothetical protein